MNVETLILIVGLSGNIAITLIGWTWKLTRVEVSIRSTIAEHRAEIDATSSQLERNVGEGLAAMRQKIHEVEMWGRDHFVLKDDFNTAIRMLSVNFQTVGDKIEARLLRMETKIDSRNSTG